MKKYKCSDYECPECMWGVCNLDNPMEECDDAPMCAEPMSMTVGELINKLKKYDSTAQVEFCVFDDLGFREFATVPEHSRLVWDEENKPVVEIF